MPLISCLMGTQVPFNELGEELLVVFVGEQLPSNNNNVNVKQIRILVYFEIYNYLAFACQY